MPQSKAWEIWKDIAYPGRVVVPGDGGPLVYDFTPADMERIARTGNGKVSDGWAIPLCWEHQDVEPVRAAVRLSRAARDREYAKSVFGEIRRFDRTPDGRLKALLAGTDPADLAQLEKVRFVSPEIQWDWTDTDGRLWPGPTVTHLAATPRPVQRHQHAVGTDPDRPHPALTLEKLVRMSLTTRPGSGRGVGARLRLSLDHYTRPPGGSAMADDADTGSDTKKPAFGGDAKKTPWQRIAESLEKAGIKIGSGENVKDADHLADLIEVAALNSQPEPEDDLPDMDDLEDPDAPPGDLEAPPEGATEPPPPVQMSLTKANEKLLTQYRDNLVRRAERLGTKGQVTPAVANDLVARVKKARLSLTANADLAESKVAVEIAAFERLPANSAWSERSGGKDKSGGKPGKNKARLSQRGNARPADEDSPYRETSPEDDDQVVDAFERAVGRAK